VSGHTIKGHVTEILRKLDAPNRTAAAVYWTRLTFGAAELAKNPERFADLFTETLRPHPRLALAVLQRLAAQLA
jgi:hypothetical protein